ncbi:MAG: hypothetical protein IKI97_07605 [Clostridia bacterium]|nr:hypothetical protein [Clostridia bacterium]
MKALFLVISILDGYFVGAFGAFLCKLIFGNSPLARLLRLVISVGGGICYCLWVLCTGASDEGTMTGFLILTFAPIAIVLILAIIGYMFDDNNE